MRAHAGAVALAALVAAGCSGGGDGAAGRLIPRATSDCVYPKARDAGSAKPDTDDPRTLVLRLEDLPRGSVFASKHGVERIAYKGNTDEFSKRTRLRAIARGSYKHGYRRPEHPPDGRPLQQLPRACSPAMQVQAAVLVFADAAGARTAYREAESKVLASAGGAGEGTRLARQASPVRAGDEAMLVEAPHSPPPAIDRTVIWRDGRVMTYVTLSSQGEPGDEALLERLARRQAKYVEAGG